MVETYGVVNTCEDVFVAWQRVQLNCLNLRTRIADGLCYHVAYDAL